jgi:hypothetical protein
MRRKSVRTLLGSTSTGAAEGSLTIQRAYSALAVQGPPRRRFFRLLFSWTDRRITTEFDDATGPDRMQRKGFDPSLQRRDTGEAGFESSFQPRRERYWDPSPRAKPSGGGADTLRPKCAIRSTVQASPGTTPLKPVLVPWTLARVLRWSECSRQKRRASKQAFCDPRPKSLRSDRLPVWQGRK